MVYLKSYECHSCHALCIGYSHKGRYWSVGICVDCGYLRCGKCNCSHEEENECVVSGKECDFFSCSAAFLNYLVHAAPEDELKLLHFGKWSPLCCEGCNASITINNMFQFDENGEYCTKCFPKGKVPKKPLVDTFMKIIEELRGYFSDKEVDSITNRGIRLESLKCTVCQKHLSLGDIGEEVDDEEEEEEEEDEEDEEDEDEEEIEEGPPICLSETAVLHCPDCSDKFVRSYPMNWSNSWYFLATLLSHIPGTKDLRLLTYSKWTPLRCEECSIVISEEYNCLPMFHPDCRKIICNLCSGTHDCTIVGEEEQEVLYDDYDDTGHDDDDCDDEERTKSPIVLAKFLVDVILEFRALFKNGGRDVEATSTIEAKDYVHTKKMSPLEKMTKVEAPTAPFSAMQENYAEDKLSSLLLQDNSFFPNTVSCLRCSRCTDTTEARNCIDCEMYGICLSCLAEEHWGHKVMKAEEGMNRVSIQDESASTLEKLARWKGHMDDMQAQGMAAQRLICDSYRSAYISALHSGNPEQLQALKEASAGQLQERATDLMTSQVKFNTAVEDLARRLQSIDRAVQNGGTSRSSQR